MGQTIWLESEDTRVELRPDLGASIGVYRSTSTSGVFDWFAAADAQRPACFALLPFCSRIRGGRFNFRGRTVSLPANNLPEPHAIHGHGFQTRWQVQQRSPQHAVLGYVHEAGAWPWRYAARQTIQLVGRELGIELEVINQSSESMPVGLGLHPYFTKTARTRVTANVGNMWALDDALMAVSTVPIPAGMELRAGLKLGTATMDHVFADWQGSARIEWPDLGAAQSCPSLVLSAESGAAQTQHNLVVYTPADVEFICVEPIGNPPDGFNLLDAGDRRGGQVLGAGEKLVQRWRFAPSFDD